MEGAQGGRGTHHHHTMAAQGASPAPSHGEHNGEDEHTARANPNPREKGMRAAAPEIPPDVSDRACKRA